MRSQSTKKLTLRNKKSKHKLLFDEGLPPIQSYPKLNSIYDIGHIKHNFGLGGASDKVVYSLAAKESRMVVIFNTKHFKLFVDKDNPSIISLSPNLPNRQVDSKLCSLLKNLKQSKAKGYLIEVSNEGNTFKKMPD